MIRDIELTFTKRATPALHQESVADHEHLIKKRKKANPASPTTDFDCFIVYDKTKKQYYFLPALNDNDDDFKELMKDAENYLLTHLTYSQYKKFLQKNSVTVKPIIDQSHIETVTGAQISDGAWQTACALTAEASAQSQSTNVGLQFAFPVGLSLIAGVIRGYRAYEDYKQKHGLPIPDEISNAILKDSAAFAAKSTIAMGAWELGFFVGQCIVSACSTTPFTFWVPAMLSICAGIFQGISAVATTIADEKRKFGEVRSSTFDLAVTFLTNFVSGAAWQICSYIPFGSLLARTVLKPAAEVVGAVLVGAATAISSYLVNKMVPKIMNIFSLLTETKPKKAMPPPQPASPTSIGPINSPTSSSDSEKKSPSTTPEPGVVSPRSVGLQEESGLSSASPTSKVNLSTQPATNEESPKSESPTAKIEKKTIKDEDVPINTYSNNAAHSSLFFAKGKDGVGKIQNADSLQHKNKSDKKI